MAASATSSRLGLTPPCISCAAASSRALRVRRFWFERPAASSISGLRQLLEDRGQVQPDVLALHASVGGILHHVQQAELERPAAAFEPERSAYGATLPLRFVDQEVFAVQPPERREPAVGQVREQRLVERP